MCAAANSPGSRTSISLARGLVTSSSRTSAVVMVFRRERVILLPFGKSGVHTNLPPGVSGGAAVNDRS